MALKTKAPKKRVEGKCCPKCGRTLPFAKFYPNKGWSEQVYRDLWCKDCVARECKSYESLKMYCYENNREWNDNTYNIA